MSKWNVRTAAGQVADVTAVKEQLAPRHDLEASNPQFGHKFGQTQTKQAWAPPTDGKENVRCVCCMSCLDRCGACLESRRGKIAVACCVIFAIIVLILGLLLFPRFPAINIDRNATFDQSKIDTSGNSTRIFGNVSMIINNGNIYSIGLKDLQVNGTIGKTAPNQVQFSQAIDELEIAAKQESRHVLPFDITVPDTVDSRALVTEIGRECVTNLLKMKIMLSGRARVTVFGNELPYSFGPQEFLTQCL